MPSNAIYIIGFIVVIAGLAYAASLAGVPTQWIVAGVVVLAGMGLLKVAKRGRSTKPFDTN